MNSDGKLRILQSLSHKELLELVLVDLFDAMSFRRIRKWHGPLEEGKDLVFCKSDPITSTEYAAAVVESSQISGDLRNDKGIRTIYFQAEEAVETPFKDLMSNRDFHISKCYIVSPYPISKIAQEKIIHKLQRYAGLIAFVDGPNLVDLIDTYTPELFLGKISSRNAYVRGLYSANRLVKNIRLIGAQEDKRVYDIYTGGELIDFSPYATKMTHDIHKYKLKSQLEKNHLLCVFGVPGAGKTLMLQKFILDMITNDDGTLVNDLCWTPVYFRVYSLNPSDVIGPKTLYDTIISRTRELGLPNVVGQKEEILLLDGFDEIPSVDSRRSFLKFLPEIQKISNAKCIITSRYSCSDEIRDYLLASVEHKAGVYSIMPFSESEKELFIKKWFKNDSVTSQRMIQWIRRNASVRSVSSTPLLLTLLAILYEIPQDCYEYNLTDLSKAEIYESISQLLLSKWDLARGIQNNFQYQDKKYFLEELAYQGHKNGKKEFSFKDIRKLLNRIGSNIDVPGRLREEFLHEIHTRGGVLILNEIGNFEFYHFSFQEFFCGSRLFRHNQEKEVLMRMKDPWWYNSLEMYSGIRRDISALYDRMWRSAKSSQQRLQMLAACLKQAKYTDFKSKKSFFHKLLNSLKDVKVVEDGWIKLLATMENLFWAEYEKVAHQLANKKDVLFRTLVEIGTDRSVKVLVGYGAAISDESLDTIISYIHAIGSTGSYESVKSLQIIHKKLRSKLKVGYLAVTEQLLEAAANYPQLNEFRDQLHLEIEELKEADAWHNEEIETKSQGELIKLVQEVAATDRNRAIDVSSSVIMCRDETRLWFEVFKVVQAIPIDENDPSTRKTYQKFFVALEKRVNRRFAESNRNKRRLRQIQARLEKLGHEEESKGSVFFEKRLYEEREELVSEMTALGVREPVDEYVMELRHRLKKIKSSKRKRSKS